MSDDLVARLGAHLLGLRPGGVARVGVDGVDGVGKTVFADRLAAAARALAPGRPVVRAGVDAWHRPRAERYRRGRDDPEGYYRDSYDYPAMRRLLLDPLGPGGDRRHRTAAYDHRSDSPVDAPVQVAADGSLLVVDGIFLQRPELAGVWDLVVFLDAPAAVTVARCAARDGTHPDPGHPSNRRYVEGQALYRAACDPAGRADVLLDHTDPSHPRLVRGPAALAVAGAQPG